MFGETIPCPVCSNAFEPEKTRITRKYCSKKCTTTANNARINLRTKYKKELALLGAKVTAPRLCDIQIEITDYTIIDTLLGKTEAPLILTFSYQETKEPTPNWLFFLDMMRFVKAAINELPISTDLMKIRYAHNTWQTYLNFMNSTNSLPEYVYGWLNSHLLSDLIKHYNVSDIPF